ncbi:MAG: 2-oxoacid:ferredoxin oxidoreductase subunit beta, partial [Thermocrispum sp.]
MTGIDLGLPLIGGLDGVPALPEDADQQKAKDFKSDQEVRWCPGCGDYAVLAAVQGFMPELGLAKEN